MTEKKKHENPTFLIGYGKPPVHSRFRKGQSGNPRGRPRGSMNKGRAQALVLKEAYRPVTIKEGDRFLVMPAIQAIMRSQVALAAKGNGPAQRSVIQSVQAIESQLDAPQPLKSCAFPDDNALSDVEVARSIAFILAKGVR